MPKLIRIGLNSPRREFSNLGLGIVVALLVRWKIGFCVFLLGIQSSCRNYSAFFLEPENYF